MEQQLKYYAEGSDLGDLTITYCDMHGLWGGTIVTLRQAIVRMSAWSVNSGAGRTGSYPGRRGSLRAFAM